MKKVLSKIKPTINIVVWILIILLYGMYIGILALINIILSYLTKYFQLAKQRIDWIVSRSMKFFRRSKKHCLRSFWK